MRSISRLVSAAAPNYMDELQEFAELARQQDLGGVTLDGSTLKFRGAADIDYNVTIGYVATRPYSEVLNESPYGSLFESDDDGSSGNFYKMTIVPVTESRKDEVQVDDNMTYNSVKSSIKSWQPAY